MSLAFSDRVFFYKTICYDVCCLNIMYSMDADCVRIFILPTYVLGSVSFLLDSNNIDNISKVTINTTHILPIARISHISLLSIKISYMALLRKQMNNSWWHQRVYSLIYEFIIHGG